MSQSKLVSANMGIILTVERNGKQEKTQMSVTCPSDSAPNLVFALGALCDFINQEFGSHIYVTGINTSLQKIAKSNKKVRVNKYISQDEFNKTIKELQP